MNTSPRDETPPPVNGVASFPDTAGRRAWMAAVTGPAAGATVDALAARSADAIPIGPLYHKSDEPPVLRNPTHPRVFGRVDHPDAALANALALEDLAGGASGLVLVLEGAPASRGFGLRIGGRDGAEAILSGVRLEAVALRFESGTLEAPVAWRGLADAMERGAAHPSTAEIDFGLDPIGAMAAGAGSAPWPEVGRQAAAAVAAVRGWGFRTPVLRADGRPHHEAGASEAQELAAVDRHGGSLPPGPGDGQPNAGGGLCVRELHPRGGCGRGAVAGQDAGVAPPLGQRSGRLRAAAAPARIACGNGVADADAA